MRHALALSALLPALLALPGASGAEPVSDLIAAQLLPGWRTEAGTHMAALRLSMAPGWKTYWRAPGEAGIPPQFDWTGSRNLGAVQLHWPVPRVFALNGMTSIGYARELVLPVEIAPRRSGEPVRLEAQINLGVCSDICVPATVTVTLDLPQAVGRADPAIKAALRARPETAREAGVRRVACSVAPIRDGMRLTAEIEVPRLGGGEFAVFETADPGIWVAEADIRRDGNRLIAVTDMVGPGGAPFALDRSGITVTLLADGRAVELRGCPAP